MSVANGDGDKLDLGREFDSLFGVDQQQEGDGHWFDVPGKAGWAVLLRSQWSAPWRNFAAKQQRRHIPLLRAKRDVPAEEVDKDQTEQLARVGLLGWRGFNGLAFNEQNVRRVMGAYPAFRTQCMEWAADRAQFRKEEMDDMGEDSPPASAPA